MTLTEQIKKQFEDLINETAQVKRRCGWDGSKFHMWPSNDDYFRIRTQGLNLIKIACGENSEHFQELRRLAESEKSAIHSMFLPHVEGVIQAAYKDFQAGLLFDTERRIRAEVLDDFLEQADFLLSEKYHIPAASLGGAVLEDTLRKMCDKHSISYPEKTKIEFLNAELARARVYDKLVQKQITAHANLRNDADHGHFEKVPPEDVHDFLKWLRRFVTENLS